jgi:hypothetical protein
VQGGVVIVVLQRGEVVSLTLWWTRSHKLLSERRVLGIKVKVSGSVLQNRLPLQQVKCKEVLGAGKNEQGSTLSPS